MSDAGSAHEGGSVRGSEGSGTSSPTRLADLTSLPPGGGPGLWYTHIHIIIVLLPPCGQWRHDNMQPTVLCHYLSQPATLLNKVLFMSLFQRKPHPLKVGGNSTSHRLNTSLWLKTSYFGFIVLEHFYVFGWLACSFIFMPGVPVCNQISYQASFASRCWNMLLCTATTSTTTNLLQLETHITHGHTNEHQSNGFRDHTMLPFNCRSDGHRLPTIQEHA